MSVPDQQMIDKLMAVLIELKESASGFQESRGRVNTRGKKGATSSNGSSARTTDSGSAVSSALASLNIEGSNINSILQALMTIVSAQVEDLKNMKVEQDKRHNELENRIRAQGDQLDEIQQRGLKGNLIISSPINDGKSCLIKSPQCLSEENTPVLDHVLGLVKQKYGVDLPAGDVQACHHLPSWQKGKRGPPEFKTVVLRVWNRVPGSAWCSLVDSIMKGGNRGTNIYANFQLTSARSSLVYNLRKLKSEKKIFKFYTNENGQVFYRTSEKSNKLKVTYYSSKPNELPKTLTVNELNSSFN